MLDHPLGASTLNVLTRRLAQQLINAVPEKTSLTDTVGTHQCRGGDVALRQPPGVLQGGRRRLDVSGDDPMPQHVHNSDDILLDTGIQQASQRRIAIQLRNVALNQVANVRYQLSDSGFQAGCNRGDPLPNPSIASFHTPIIGPAAMLRPDYASIE